MRRLTRDVSKWNIYQHREARELPAVDKEDAREVQLQDEMFDRLYAGPSPALADADKDALGQWATRLHGICDSMPTYARLATDCKGDVDASATAVESLLKHLEPHMKRETTPGQPPMVNNAGAPLDMAAVMRKAVTRACVVAEAKIAEQREAAEALGQVRINAAGTGKGNGAEMDQAGPREIAKRLEKDRRLKQIVELAGRFQRIAARKQRSKVQHGADEISDVETGADIGRLLPVELASLMHPLRKLVLLRNLVERRAMQYHLTGTDTVGRGPLVCLLDKSSSMDGSRDVWATAVALALMWVAQRQKRVFAMITYDAGVKTVHVVNPGDALPEAALFVTCSGGTTISAAYDRALDIIATVGNLKKADIVLVSDGADHASAERAPAQRERAKALGVTSIGAAIGVNPSDLAPWCDQAMPIHDLASLDDRTSTAMFTL